MYSVQINKNSWFSHPTSTGRTGVSAKPSVEALESRSLMDASTFIQSLYANILQRAPKPAEVNAWVSQIDSGMALPAVTAAFAGSSERLQEVVSSDYNKFFGRNPSSQEVNFWVQQLTAGVSQDQVAASLVGSEEFLMRHGSTFDQFIEGAYETVLGRAAQPPELAYWKQQLSTRTNFQMTVQDVASRIVGSDEAHQDQVDAIFAEVLHRNPDGSGSAFWSNFLDNGGSQTQMISALASSPEYLEENGMTQAD